jgi:predicted 3-demethylubiquinone-9 3-methyltransferase (glyoxalase superfamily)
MPKIMASLWFDGQAEEAAAFYTSVFPHSAITAVTRYGPDMPGADGTVATVAFTLEGLDFLAINGGPEFTFDEAVSFPVICADQAEVDYYWSRLGDGGEESVCGWLKDRFGLSWQIIPQMFIDVVSGDDAEAAQRATHAMLGMKKLVVADLERAAAGS